MKTLQLSCSQPWLILCLVFRKDYDLLNDYYHDMTQAIIETDGEIYQYVGDEIVVSWKMDMGLENYNCINCFFKIKSILNDNQ